MALSRSTKGSFSAPLSAKAASSSRASARGAADSRVTVRNSTPAGSPTAIGGRPGARFCVAGYNLLLYAVVWTAHLMGVLMLGGSGPGGV